MGAPSTPPFGLDGGERVVASVPASSIRGLFLTSGRLWLTDRRLYFQPVVMWLFWLAPLVGLVLWVMARSHETDVPLADIEAHGRAKYGRNPNMLRLQTRAHVQHAFLVEPFDPFHAELAKQPAFTSKALPT